ncbi:uncharacterized protein MYCFIDRAFT_185585 [Pseudocercospora fijiensis CIRAD86]|uniref:Uncharacterized protein n=1 Tax=Pseudocercospora fijiensis (strain CIRAD86) TaxID=383855 RepID=N1QCP5_PSEFD|nr:uncharacterized protein MYCFIDRAFT_185585 [Pseudocercospora fijiensis CIRAD86]EME89203.1 hypothetical protein MYCFIDRAFT_185585 [Pseudocercospora fijiensis CIRAD86]
MSVVLTRSPLEVVGMNGSVSQKRRSARLSGEGNSNEGAENEPPTKKAKVNGASTTTTSVNTKQQDGDQNKTASKKKRKEYTDEADDFKFARKGSRRKKDATNSDQKQISADKSAEETTAAPAEPPAPEPVADEPVPKTAQKKTRKRLPTTPELGEKEKPVRRSKRLSNEAEEHAATQPSPHRASHAKSHANAERQASPARGRPLTIEKNRKAGNDGGEEAKVMRIMLPFADTPVQRRNKEMRKGSGENGRRSSAGLRGKRASSVIDEGRGHAMPHSEVPSSEFFKHISADLTEPRRMRCLLGWCGIRLLPPKPTPPAQSAPTANQEFQALQAARVIQEELSQDLVNNGMLSDWFSRDESVPPQLPLRKKPNPRNIANATKAEELERELERLKSERAEWDELVKSAAAVNLQHEEQSEDGPSSVHPGHLDSPQRAIFEQLQSAPGASATDPAAIQERLRTISNDIEFAVDRFVHGIHALKTTRDTAERVADKSLGDAAHVLDQRERQRHRASDKGVGQMDALRGLARVLNAQQRR